jgi:hypothetical protein
VLLLKTIGHMEDNKLNICVIRGGTENSFVSIDIKCIVLHYNWMLIRFESTDYRVSVLEEDFRKSGNNRKL